ncbi:MAG: ABC transporter ATP-binding protein [Shimia sp.]|nr:ABC transporter ATP-binding protein [Shimia sp.]
MSQQELLSVQNLDVRYGAVHAVMDFSFSVNKGEIVTILGANGAGKSSTLNALVGLAPSAVGKITFDGKDITKSPTEKIIPAGLTLTPEGRHVFADMTVMENLRLGGAVIKDGSNSSVLSHMLELFPILEEREHQLAGTLSGGEQQMLTIARSLMSKPKLLILDEPSLGLAPLVIKEVFRLISRLRDEGTTILLVEQNAAQSLEIADRAYLLELGAMSKSGTAAEFLSEFDLAKIYLGG